MDDIAGWLGGVEVGPYPEVPKAALALPILLPGREKPAVVLVCGVSSRLPLNDAYRDFYDLIAVAISAAVANAGACESERRNAGALQSAIFNSANFSSIATDAAGVIQIFNVGAERMLGHTAAEVMNKVTPADISDPHEVIARAKALSVELETPITPGFEALVFKASRGIEDIYELTYIRKDGSRFPAVVSVTALRDAHDVIIGYLLIGTDNTARQQLEEERRKLDQRLRDQHFYTRSLIESNIDALMTCDPRGIITDINKQTETLTGCTRDELIGAPFKNSFTDPARAEAGIKRVLTEGKVTNYEFTARARDGRETVVSYNATIFHDRDRSLQGVFAAARDVTELKRFEQTLVQKNAELEDVKLGLFPISERRTLKVLVVDDDPKAVELIALRIQGLASTVIRAYGGREAIEAARLEHPDLIVLDLMMPEVNGFDVGEALKAQSDTTRIPIVVVTATQITAEDRARLNGYVSAIMEKVSFDPHGSIAEVRRAMSGRSLAA